MAPCGPSTLGHSLSCPSARHCIRRFFFFGLPPAHGCHSGVDAAHFLDLHPKFDDLELIQPRHLVGAMTLLAFAEGDSVGQPDELAVRAAVSPPRPSETEEGMSGAADVGVVDEAERRFVTELGP